MYPLVRIDKRIPDGSIWQTRWGYLIPPVNGWTRVYQPTGTRWSNPLGGWIAKGNGIALFHPERPFAIAHYGPTEPARYYIDIAHGVRVGSELIEFMDLFLDVLIDPTGRVSEKDEHQLIFLRSDERRFARAARDEVRRLIAAKDPLFDPRGPYFDVPDEVRGLPPSVRTAEVWR